MATALAKEPVQELPVPEGVIQTETGWRYIEWANGGFIRELGMGDQVIDPSLIPQAPDPSASEAIEPEPLDPASERPSGEEPHAESKAESKDSKEPRKSILDKLF